MVANSELGPQGLIEWLLVLWSCVGGGGGG